jgi:hypothetical protein
MAENISLNERADALERKMSDELDVLISKSALFNMADGKLGAVNMGSDSARRRQVLSDGRRSAVAEDATESDAPRLFHLPR